MLSTLRVHPSSRELQLPFKDDIKQWHIFRRCEKTCVGFTMSDQPITQGMISAWVKRVGKLLGFEKNTICYSLRYMAGNNLDQHGACHCFPPRSPGISDVTAWQSGCMSWAMSLWARVLKTFLYFLGVSMIEFR